MLDIRLIRENPEKVKELLLGKEYDASETIDKILTLDQQRREVMLPESPEQKFPGFSGDGHAKQQLSIPVPTDLSVEGNIAVKGNVTCRQHFEHPIPHCPIIRCWWCVPLKVIPPVCCCCGSCSHFRCCCCRSNSKID